MGHLNWFKKRKKNWRRICNKYVFIVFVPDWSLYYRVVYTPSCPPTTLLSSLYYRVVYTSSCPPTTLLSSLYCRVVYTPSCPPTTLLSSRSSTARPSSSTTSRRTRSSIIYYLLFDDVNVMCIISPARSEAEKNTEPDSGASVSHKNTVKFPV